MAETGANGLAAPKMSLGKACALLSAAAEIALAIERARSGTRNSGPINTGTLAPLYPGSLVNSNVRELFVVPRKSGTCWMVKVSPSG